MGLFTRLLTGPAAIAERKAAQVATPTIMDAMPEAISWPTDDDFPSYGMAYGLYAREYAVRVVVDFISRQIASLPLKVYRKRADGSAEEAPDSMLARLMKRPSPLRPRERFVESLLRDMLLDDRWLCVVGLDKTSGDYTLRRIPPDSYSLQANAYGELTQVTVGSDGTGPVTRYPLPDPRVVMDIGYLDSLDFGNPVANVLRSLLAEARAMAAYRRKISSNAPQTPAYIFRPKEVPWESQEDYDDFVEALRNYQSGGGREGAWLPLRDGMEVREIGSLFKPVDMNDLEARDKINEQVALAFQISPENIGFRTGTNSNIAAYKEKLWNVELLPYLTAFEEALNFTLPAALGEPDCYVKANLDAKLRGTLETQYQALSTATGRPFMETNRARALLDMPPVPGGDELITPLNVTEGGQPSPQDGGQTQNAQTSSSPNGKALDMLAEFRRAYAYDARFRTQWDDMMKGGADEARP
ncbi:phage portal protein [Bifidobacterium platyrrhinorum]|uniref:Phage portal protein n=1 Tax=Bifidobacterium platyrrhinorum TaxID=2661628 RepID=A0A6L9SYE2_9BIFI|nr:phage portal protein [Bifidobacterium platyrrhinorum]NEG56141.1 phage portal protein [Bifidobacterium platyrrhinorum]